VEHVPADPSLHGLRELFPSEGAPGFVARAAEELFQEPVDERDGKPVYARYWPGRRCVVLWSFPGADAPRLVSGTLFSDGRGARTVERSAFRRLLQSAQDRHGPDRSFHRFLPDHRVLLMAFPLDGRLRGLPAADSKEWIRSVLCPAVGLEPASITRIEHQALNFKPWRRCVFRYRVHRPEGASGFFAKVFRDDRGAVLFDRALAVHRHLAAADRGWDTPRPVSYLPEEKIVVFEELRDAVEVSDLLHDAGRESRARDRLIEGFERAGSVAGELREAKLEGLPRVPPHAVLASLRKRAENIARVEPEFAFTVERELDRLGAEVERREPEPLVPAHAAYRHDQLLLRGNRLAVLDLDGLCLSGTSADAGHFLGFLDMARIRRPRKRDLLAVCEDAFVRGLRSGNDRSLEWLSWYRAAAQIKKAVRSFLSLDSKWRSAAAALDEGLVEATLGCAGSPR
jgi:hypothetical protein